MSMYGNFSAPVSLSGGVILATVGGTMSFATWITKSAAGSIFLAMAPDAAQSPRGALLDSGTVYFLMSVAGVVITWLLARKAQVADYARDQKRKDDEAARDKKSGDDMAAIQTLLAMHLAELRIRDIAQTNRMESLVIDQKPATTEVTPA